MDENDKGHIGAIMMYAYVAVDLRRQRDIDVCVRARALNMQPN